MQDAFEITVILFISLQKVPRIIPYIFYDNWVMEKFY